MGFSGVVLGKDGGLMADLKIPFYSVTFFFETVNWKVFGGILTGGTTMKVVELWDRLRCGELGN